jgi:acetolactate synthase-1/2/3 large subunit
MVRENLPVVTVMFANHAYRILNIEMSRTRSGNAGPQSRKLLDLGDPRMDWVSLAKGFGMPAVRVETAEAFDAALARALAGDGPSLIEAVLG